MNQAKPICNTLIVFTCHRFLSLNYLEADSHDIHKTSRKTMSLHSPPLYSPQSSTHSCIFVIYPLFPLTRGGWTWFRPKHAHGVQKVVSLTFMSFPIAIRQKSTIEKYIVTETTVPPHAVFCSRVFLYRECAFSLFWKGMHSRHANSKLVSEMWVGDGLFYKDGGITQ